MPLRLPEADDRWKRRASVKCHATRIYKRVGRLLKGGQTCATQEKKDKLRGSYSSNTATCDKPSLNQRIWQKSKTLQN